MIFSNCTLVKNLTLMGHTRLQGRARRERILVTTEGSNGQVGCAPVAFLMVILDKTVAEEESDATEKEGQENIRPTEEP